MASRHQSFPSASALLFLAVVWFLGLNSVSFNVAAQQVSTQLLNHPIANKACTSDKDCLDTSLSEDEEDGLHPIPQLQCLNSTCQCDPAKTIFAAVRVSYTATHVGSPDFVGYSFLYPGNRTMCAPKRDQPCAGRGYCAPGSYCVYHHVFSQKGLCKCNPGTTFNEASGLCECRGKQTLTEDGVCSGKNFNETCDAHDSCGLDMVSRTDLVCSASGKCGCNETVSVYASVRSSHPAVHVLAPEFRGFGPVFTESGMMCSPKPGQVCAGRGYCAPGSYCVYNSADTWKGVCRCIPGTTLNNATGGCECRGGQSLDEFGVCAGVSLNATCSSDAGCGVDSVSGFDLVCTSGTCQCNVTLSTLANVRTSNTQVHQDFTHFKGYHNHTVLSGDICAPKAGQKCAGRGFCAPGAYCVYASRETWQGVCQCVPGTKLNPSTGTCDCKPGQTLTEDGVCNGSSLNETCRYRDDCGIDPESNLELICNEGVCQCDSSATFATVQTSHIAVHTNEPDYFGYISKFGNATLCAPKPGNPCVGRGYCAPRSYCVYATPRTWIGTCRCIPNTELNAQTGECECLHGYFYDEQSKNCKVLGAANPRENEVPNTATAGPHTGDSPTNIGITLGWVLIGVVLTVALVGAAVMVLRKYAYPNGPIPLQFPLRRSGTQLL